MSLSDLASLGSFVSGFAVLVSLIYLALQIRQAEKNQQATIRQTRMTRAVELGLANLEPTMNEAWRCAVAQSENISERQVSLVMGFARANFLHFEDSYYQYKDGLLSDTSFETLRASLAVFFGIPTNRYAWRTFRNGFAKDFVGFVDDLVASTPVASPVDAFASWKAGVATEKVPHHTDR